MPCRARHRPAATVVTVAVTLAVASAGCGQGHQPVVPTCTAEDVVLTVEQAANATTIAAVGKRMGVPNEGVTVALATALQESALRNLDYGDRDSLGLFQQRPSQGWGSAEQVMTPHLAAAAFYRRLVRVRSWRTRPVTEVAQAVQRSGAPEAYAQWEAPARTLGRALTGEREAGLACRFDQAASPPPAQLGALRRQAVTELGPGGLDRAAQPDRRWVTACWLVAHAQRYGVSRVSLAGRTWTAASGVWKADPKAAALQVS